jgi:hypothetical protein
MKDYTKRNASYRGIPCWFNPINDELKGKNKLYEFLLVIMLWIDINIFEVEEFPIWVEVDELENNQEK